MDNKKIAIMVQLAIYNKKYADVDKKIMAYFREDYVYKKNFFNRIIIFFGSVIVLAIDYGMKIFINNMDPFSFNIQGEISYIIKFLLISMIIYTIIGSLKFNYEYSQSEKRIEQYEILSKRLDEISTKENGEDIL